MSVYTRSLGELLRVRSLESNPTNRIASSEIRLKVARDLQANSYREQESRNEEFFAFVKGPLHNIIVGLLSGIDLYNDLSGSQFNLLKNLGDAKLAKVLVKTLVDLPDPKKDPIPAADYLFFGSDFCNLAEDKKEQRLKKFFKKTRVAIETIHYLYQNIQRIRKDGKPVLINGAPAEEVVPEMILSLISGTNVESNRDSLEEVLSRGVFKKKKKKNPLSRYLSASKTAYNKSVNKKELLPSEKKMSLLLKNFSYIPHRITDIVKTELARYNKMRGGIDTELLDYENITSSQNVYDAMVDLGSEEGSKEQESLYDKVIAGKSKRFENMEVSAKKQFLEATFNCLRYSKTPISALKILRNNIELLFEDGEGSAESIKKVEFAVLNRLYEKGQLDPQDENYIGILNYTQSEVRESATALERSVDALVESTKDLTPFGKYAEKFVQLRVALQNTLNSNVFGREAQALLAVCQKFNFSPERIGSLYNRFGEQEEDGDYDYLMGKSAEVTEMVNNLEEKIKSASEHPLALRSWNGYNKKTAPISLGQDVSTEDAMLSRKLDLVLKSASEDDNFRKQTSQIVAEVKEIRLEQLASDEEEGIRTRKTIEGKVQELVVRMLSRSEYAFGALLSSAKDAVITQKDRLKVQKKTSNIEINQRRIRAYLQRETKSLNKALDAAFEDNISLESALTDFDSKVDLSSDLARIEGMLDSEGNPLTSTPKKRLIREAYFRAKQNAIATQQIDGNPTEQLEEIAAENKGQTFISEFLNDLATFNLISAERKIALFKDIAPRDGDAGTDPIQAARELAHQAIIQTMNKGLNNPLNQAKSERREADLEAEEKALSEKDQAVSYLEGLISSVGDEPISLFYGEALSLVQADLDDLIEDSDFAEDMELPEGFMEKVSFSKKLKAAKRRNKINYEIAKDLLIEKGELRYVDNFNPTVDLKKELVFDEVAKKLSGALLDRVNESVASAIEAKRNRTDKENTFLTRRNKATKAAKRAMTLRAKLGDNSFDAVLKSTKIVSQMNTDKLSKLYQIAEKYPSSFSTDSKTVKILLNLIYSSYTSGMNAVTKEGVFYKSGPLFENFSQFEDVFRFFASVHYDPRSGGATSEIALDLARIHGGKLSDYIAPTVYDEDYEPDVTSYVIDKGVVENYFEGSKGLDDKLTALRTGYVSFGADLTYLLVSSVMEQNDTLAGRQILALFNSGSASEMKMLRDTATKILLDGPTSPVANLISSIKSSLERDDKNLPDAASFISDDDTLRKEFNAAGLSENSLAHQLASRGSYEGALLEVQGAEIFSEIGTQVLTLVRRGSLLGEQGERNTLSMLSEVFKASLNDDSEEYVEFRARLKSHVSENLDYYNQRLNTDLGLEEMMTSYFLQLEDYLKEQDFLYRAERRGLAEMLVAAEEAESL